MANRLLNIQKKKDIFKNVKYYKNIEYPSIPVSPDDIYIISKSTDRLDLLANDYYNDSRDWWIISKANPDKVRRDSLFLDPGFQIRIPMNIEKIHADFKNLNK
jgi:nitrous oxide reductase